VPATSYATSSFGFRETASELHSFLASLEAEPGRLEALEASLDAIAETKRRFRCETYGELLARAAEARAELDALDGGKDPAAVAAEALRSAEERFAAIAAELRAERNAAAPAFADAVASELHDVGMGEGEFVCELNEREPSATGGDEAVFLVRPERRPAARSGRRDGVGRRALPDRARDRRRRGRRDPRVRRDRRRDRR